MTVLYARARWLATIVGICAAVGLFASFMIVGFYEGVQSERRPPTIENAKIDLAVHAGDNLTVHEIVNVGTGCVPRLMRYLTTKRDSAAHDNEYQPLTDTALVPNGTVHIPVPRDTIARQWYYHELVSTQGCGAMSGFLAPQTAEARDPIDGLPGIKLTVLPYLVIPDH